MTREEAIKVLRTESIELGGSAPSVCRFWEALDMAVSALQQQDSADKDFGKNEPLTLEELRDMPCEPVYIVVGCASWWDIVSYAGMEYLYLKVEGSLPFRDYGKNWTAYRQKPEEDKHETD